MTLGRNQPPLGYGGQAEDASRVVVQKQRANELQRLRTVLDISQKRLKPCGLKESSLPPSLMETCFRLTG